MYHIFLHFQVFHKKIIKKKLINNIFVTFCNKLNSQNLQDKLFYSIVKIVYKCYNLAKKYI